MPENSRPPIVWPFWLELVLAIFIPFIITFWLSPADIVSSSPLVSSFQLVGVYGSGLMLLFGIPLGIIGFIKSGKMKKRRVFTLALSAINISAAIAVIGIMGYLFLKMVMC